MSPCTKKKAISASAKRHRFYGGHPLTVPLPLAVPPLLNNFLISKTLPNYPTKNNAADEKQPAAENVIDKSVINKNFTLVVR